MDSDRTCQLCGKEVAGHCVPRFMGYPVCFECGDRLVTNKEAVKELLGKKGEKSYERHERSAV